MAIFVKSSVSGYCLAFAQFFANFSLVLLMKRACTRIENATFPYRSSHSQMFTKKNSNTDVFLWILRNFFELLSLHNYSGDYFLPFKTVLKKLVLRINWRLSTILKTSNKSVRSNVFWYVEVCIFWKCIRYTIHWDKIQILKKFTSDKINGTKNDLFFSWAPTHHSFTFNLRFLYELKHTVRLSKNVCVCVFLFY